MYASSDTTMHTALAPRNSTRIQSPGQRRTHIPSRRVRLMARPKAAPKSQHQHRSSSADKGADKVPALSIAAEDSILRSCVRCATSVPQNLRMVLHIAGGSGSILSPSIRPSHHHTIASPQHHNITPSHHATVTSAATPRMAWCYDVCSQMRDEPLLNPRRTGISLTATDNR